MAKESEKEICDQINLDNSEAEKYRSQFHEEWEEYEKFYNGEHWDYAIHRSKKNWVWATIEAVVPILTDSRPGVSIVPYEEDGSETAKILEAGVLYSFEQGELQMKITQSVRSSLITGTGWIYVDWDPDLENGEGNVIYRNLGWRQVFIDPTANEINEASYVHIHTPMKIKEVERRFPKFKGEIPVVSTNGERFQNIDNQVPDPTRWSPPNSTDNEVSRYDLNDMTVLEEAWFKDYSLESIPEEETQRKILEDTEMLMQGKSPDIGKFEDHDEHIKALQRLLDDAPKMFIAANVGINEDEVTDEVIGNFFNQIPEAKEELSLIMAMINDHIEMHALLKDQGPGSKRPKYRNNLRLVIKVGGMILYDGEPPVDDGLVPLVPIYGYKDENSIYGVGEVKNILPAQKSYNEMDNAEKEGLLLTSNAGWIVDENSGVDEATLTNEPGLVVVKAEGTEVRRLDPGATSPQLTNRKQFDREAIEAISGIGEVARGGSPSGVTAARAIRILQEQAVSRIRQKSRTLEEYSLPRIGRLTASRILKYWATERKLRIYDEGGRIRYVDYDPTQVQRLRYEVKVSPGTTAGLDKESIFVLMQSFVQQGLITPKTFFETIDVPFKTKILQDLEEQNELTQAIQALQAENEQLKEVLAQVEQEVTQEEQELGVGQQAAQPQQPINQQAPPQGQAPL